MEKIAIIGISCLFPGAETPDQFWNNLIEGKDTTSLATAEDMGVDPAVFYDPEIGKTDRYYCQRGGFVRDFQFDPNGYCIPPKDLEKLDNIFKWPLYTAKQALIDSGYVNSQDVLSNCGLILGNLSFPTKSTRRLLAPVYQAAIESELQKNLNNKHLKLPSLSDTPNAIDPHNGLISGYPPAVVAQALQLGGATFAIDAACASSLYGIDLACRYLQTGQADLMLAGATSCADPLFIHMGFSIFHAYPQNGQSNPLDQSSSGLIAAEGSAMCVLKRYADAIRDNDHIYAVIRGTGLSNDGKGKFVLNPNPQGQILSFKRAYEHAKIDPAKIDYIECHATGTPVGDMAELDSIATFWEAKDQYPHIGSVKSNLGHMLSVAGMGSLLKVILSMEKGKIPPTIGVKAPQSSNNKKVGQDQIITTPTDWPNQDHIYRAGINAFGFGGTNAHMIIEQNSEPIKTEKSMPQMPKTPMAIIGMEATLGGCSDLNAFANSIYHGTQHTTTLPSQRWKGIKTEKAPEGAYLKNANIDFLTIKTPPNDTDQPIPQQLLMLDVANRALKDANLKPNGNIGIIIAMGTELAIHQYLGRCDLTWQIQNGLEKAGITLSPAEKAELEAIAKNSLHSPAQVNQYTSFIGNIMAGRIAALWNFSGPAFTLSSEENSVPRALEVAHMFLSAKEVDAMLVGAVDLSGGLEHMHLRTQLAPNNTQKHSLAYDQHVNGWTVGEGSGAIVLKRLKDAQTDRIYATIDAISIKPNTDIVQASQQALKMAQKNPTDIGYIEVSGSGIENEDKTEIENLVQSYHTPETTCAIGSVKANIGHTFSASGIASLLKTALCLYHRYVPGTPNWTAPKNHVPNNPFYVPTESRPWFQDSGKRTAAINSLGMDGHAAHIILSENPKTERPKSNRALYPAMYLFPIAAQNQQDMLASLKTLEQDLQQNAELSKTAYQYFNRYQNNTPSPFVLSLVGGTQEEILKQIQDAQKGIPQAFETGKPWSTPTGSYFTANPLGTKGKVAFVYPGSANAYVGMGRELWQLFPQAFDQISHISKKIGDHICERQLYPRSLQALSIKERKTIETQLAQDAIAMFQTGIGFAVLNTLIMRDTFKINPHLTFGYSLGESSMMFALGVWHDPDTVARAMASSTIFKNDLFGPKIAARKAWGLPDNDTEFWNTYALRANVSDIKACLKNEPRVYLTMINTPKEAIIAGDTEGCQRVIKQLKCKAFKVPFNGVLHCDTVNNLLYDTFVNLHTLPVHPVSNIDFYSAIDCTPIELTTEAVAHNIGKTISNAVDFPRIVNKVYEDNARIFIDLGPRGTAATWINQILSDQPHATTRVDRKGKDNYSVILKALATLVSHHVAVDLTPLYDTETKDQEQKSLNKIITLGGPIIKDAIPSYKKIKHDKNLNNHSTHISPKPSLPTQPINTPTPQIHMPTLPDNAISQTRTALSQSHATFLSLRSEALQKQSEILQLQTNTLQQILSTHSPIEEQTQHNTIVWNQADLLEFAKGNIANVFGPDYAVIDAYTRRVRLPMPPYLLVSRITHLQGERGLFKPSSMTTEYDIPQNAWYSVDGQIPWAVAVESGQCDLLLISYLGIDFESKGERIYRLLDCTLTFLDDMPLESETLRYDIKINSFSRSGDSLLFFFSYECFVKDKMVLKMDGGCAGFFTDQELSEGKGVIFTEAELKAKRAIQKQAFQPPLTCNKTTFDYQDLLHLTQGDIASCFGESYQQTNQNVSLRLPPENMLMIDRIASVDAKGGAWGLGLIVAEKDLAPDDWYFPCHFKDDQVLAGSLMGEACSQLMQFYQLYLGLHTHTQDARFQPIANLPQKVRCRGQVTPSDTLLTYKMEIKKIGLDTTPYAIADVEAILDGKTIVHFQDLGMQLSEKSDTDPYRAQLQETQNKAPLFNETHITEFATGSISACFGSDYHMYENKRCPRTPNGDLQLISRICDIDGQRGNMTPGSHLLAEYDVPANPWFYRKNTYPTLPYSITMEIGLQPCGFLSAYLGSTLPYPDTDFYFRNLDGQGHLVEEVDVRGKTIQNRVHLLSSTALDGVIIQKFTYELSCENKPFYYGDAAFGYFVADALTHQVGLDNGKQVLPWFKTQGKQGLFTNLNEDALHLPSSNQPHYCLASDQLHFLDNALVIANGGRCDQGYVYANKKIDPQDWFYTCHFYQDPVMPGSLGVEAILEAMQVYALEQNLGKPFQSPRFGPVAGLNTIWKYRGQIVSTNKDMSLEIHIKKVEHNDHQCIVIGDASLWKEDMRIYDVKDVGICISEA